MRRKTSSTATNGATRCPIGVSDKQTRLEKIRAAKPELEAEAADSDDFAQAFRFQIAQDSDLISPTVPS